MANIKRAIELSVPIGKLENDRSASLVDCLRSKDIDAHINYNSGPDIIGNDFIIEGKWDLLSKVVLDRLIGQLNGYMNRYHHRIFVVIYNDAKKSLLNELKDFCWRQDYVPGVEVVVYLRTV